MDRIEVANMGDHLLLLAAIYFAVMAVVGVGIAIILAAKRSGELRRLERYEDELRLELEKAIRRRSI